MKHARALTPMVPIIPLLLLLLHLAAQNKVIIVAADEGGDDDTNWDATKDLWSSLDESLDETEANRNDTTNFGSVGFYHRNDTCASTNPVGNNDEECVDSLPNCGGIARIGECATKWEECRKSCLACHPSDENKFSIGVPQYIPNNLHLYDDELSSDNFSQADMMIRMAVILTETQQYMSNIVHQEDKYKAVRRSCRNYDQYCAAYAAVGFCEDDFHGGDEYAYMVNLCSPACKTCDEYETVQPCEENPAFNYYNEGDLNKMFQRMVGERTTRIPLPQNFQPVIHSRPGGGSRSENNSSNSNDGIRSGSDDAEEVVDGPWIVTLENFLTDEECDRLRELGKLDGYKKSELQKKEEEKEYKDYRTSKNTWCDEACASDPIAQEAIRRIGQTTGIPQQYSEPLQLLRYNPGEFYGEHHDVVDEDFSTKGGNARMVTFFLYLNDVEEGGATRMVDVKYDGISEGDAVPLTIHPKKGMALVWPNLNDDDHTMKEDGTWHEALPVVKGQKFGANAWFAQRRLNSRCDENLYYEWQRSHGLLNDDELEEEEKEGKADGGNNKEGGGSDGDGDYSLIPDM